MIKHCNHDRLLMPSGDYPGKYFCRGCEKRFDLVEWLPKEYWGKSEKELKEPFKSICGGCSANIAGHPCPIHDKPIDVVEKLTEGPEEDPAMRRPCNCGGKYCPGYVEGYRPRDYYTKEEADKRHNWVIDRVNSFLNLKERVYNTEYDEQAFKKALLDYLALPNLGNPGEHLTHDELWTLQADLRKRFT